MDTVSTESNEIYLISALIMFGSQQKDRPSISQKATLSRHVQSIIFFEHHRSRSRTNRGAVNIE